MKTKANPASHPRVAVNLAGTFLARGFTVSRADHPARCRQIKAWYCASKAKGQFRHRNCPQYCRSKDEGLLVVLAVEKTRDFDRLGPIIFLVFADLSFRSSASDVGHPLE